MYGFVFTRFKFDTNAGKVIIYDFLKLIPIFSLLPQPYFSVFLMIEYVTII